MRLNPKKHTGPLCSPLLRYRAECLLFSDYLAHNTRISRHITGWAGGNEICSFYVISFIKSQGSKLCTWDKWDWNSCARRQMSSYSACPMPLTIRSCSDFNNFFLFILSEIKNMFFFVVFFFLTGRVWIGARALYCVTPVQFFFLSFLLLLWTKSCK